MLGTQRDILLFFFSIQVGAYIKDLFYLCSKHKFINYAKTQPIYLRNVSCVILLYDYYQFT